MLDNKTTQTEPLNAAITHFLEYNENPQQTKNTLFNLLHLAFESKTVEHYDMFERSNLFFVVREVNLLIDAIELNRKEVKHDAS